MKYLLFIFLLTGCSHYITEGRERCDKREQKYYANEKYWKNDKLMEKHVKECSRYYDEF